MLVLLAGSLWYAIGIWNAVDSDPLPPGLMIAMVLGSLFSLLVGVGLTALMIYSNRRGYDDRANEPPPKD